ncbi:MAG: aminotransferase class I/II-fold pyridoxal phosphate-dependent enzyme [Alphaproteobacteria bacterium]|nr:aminotransferase class I/II-fold pyridoxal phosphate-dependent enzyme [Alphaproteobacteria bacterium]
MNNEIAIVGMGCRFAGAQDLDAYWKMTLEGRNGFGPVPPDRWSHEQFFDANPRATDKSYAPNGGFIDDIRTFPALVLGIPPRRVEVMDPQQRMSIEIALAAIQDAGSKPADLPRRTGVYMGVTAAEWRVLVASRVIAQFMASGMLGDAPVDLDGLQKAVANIVPSRPYSAPGVLSNMIAAAVAQELDLHGPAYTVDAACASAMVAVSDAVAGLVSGDIDCAVAGGVYLAITPEHHVAFSRIGAISRSGACLPFDARADGFVQGDGAGAIVLKRLDDAVAAGDRVYAVIRGVSTNNDGRGDGPMAPVMDGQVEVVHQAWKRAGLDPATLGYVETHGTGTEVGDVTEFTGLMKSVGTRAKHVALGSSKANVGHTMSAAGIAGMIRAALAIHHGVIPPMAGFESAKPDLGLDGSPFRVPKSAEAWEGHRVACVSSFGFGGTNGHAVLEGNRAPLKAKRAQPTVQPELLVLSSGDRATLQQSAGTIARALRDEPSMTVAGVARALAVRTPLPVRAAFVVSSRDEAIAQLEKLAAGEEHDGREGTSNDAPSVAYLFPGQGAQRLDMLRDARERFPIVSGTLAEVEAELGDLLPLPLTHLLYPDARTTPVDAETADAELTHTAHCQPVMFACSLALSRLLDSVGVRPVAATGHSLGEFNAAVVGGVVSARDAARFVAARGRGMADVAGDPGAMAAVMADRETVLGLLGDGVVIANVNHPRQLVVSGTTEGVAALVERATAAGVSAKPLTVSHAFHSPIFADLDARPWLADVQLNGPTLTVASCIAEKPYGSAADARAVFERHARSPVEFVRALQQCRDAGADLFLQVGAGGPLASFARGAVDGARGIHTLGGRDDRDGGRSILEGLAWLWVNGVDLDTRAITADADVATLPTEILPREPYWAVKDVAQKALKLKAVERAMPAQAAQAPVSEAPAAKPAADEAVAKVMAVVAKVSAYPLDALKPAMRLIDDLGFDSLMVGDLATGLAEAFPGLGGIPQELLINGPTVQDLVDYVKSVGDGVAAHDDDAPLLSYAPVWRDAALVGAVERDLRRRVALLVGDVGDLAGLLAARGVTTTTDREEPADVVFWHAQGDEAGELIALLASQIDRGGDPDLVVLRDPGDVDAESVAGVVRAFGAERDARAKTVETGANVGERLLAEWLDADRTSDVRYAPSRQVPGFAPAPSLEAIELGAGDTVLVTGGTRGIGRAVSEKLAARGCTVLAVGRSGAEIPGVTVVTADVTRRDQLAAAVRGHAITAVVHAAGLLADGPIEATDAARGAQARSVKVDGWRNALAVAPNARVALGIGSWAGRFGNRHQAHYAAANAHMAALAEASGIRAVVAEFGPWTNSDMVRTIPTAIQSAMRAEGIDFVGDDAGLNALLDDLRTGRGIRTHGRDLPFTTRSVRVEQKLSTATHPYLLDHAIDGTPVLPLASATDLLAEAAAVPTPFEVDDLRLFQGITVTEPVDIEVRVRGDRAELRVGARKALAYRARVRPFTGELPALAPIGEGQPPGLALAAFYDGLTFHGPMLQGITAIEAVGPDFVRGRVRTGRPADWIPGTDRTAFAVDPLALDSAMQLSGYVAWTRYERAGTPVGIGRLVQLAPLPEGELVAEVRFGEREENRFSGTITLSTAQGELLLVAEGTVAELRKVKTEGDPLEGFEIKPEWVDPTTWPALKDIDMRLQMAQATGIKNPYFTVHQGTARNITHVDGRELINFSSYNYLGLSGDPRVVEATQAAVAKFGTSVSASRVASGERPFHGDLEKLLAQCQDVEDTLVFTAGHATNVTTIGHLLKPGDLVMHDELIHDSALQGIKLAGCARRGFKHDDPQDLENQLRELRRHYERVLIVVEGVYSMDGDICDLPAYVAIKKKYGCMLMCDEAHSFGVIGKTGCGAREHFGIPGSDVDIWMGTLSKSVASCGGWIGGSAALIRYLRYTAPGFVYSAGITPANGMAALRSLELMLEEPWRVEKLQRNAAFFHDELVKRGIDTGPALGGSAVVPAVTGNSLHALLLSQRLIEQGVNVQPIVYPAVADDAARLRFFLSSTHTEDQLRHSAELVATTLARVREEFPAPR